MLCDCSGGGLLVFVWGGVLVSFCVSKVVFRKFPRKSVWGDSLCVFSLGRPPSFLGGSPTVCLCLLACVCLFVFSFGVYKSVLKWYIFRTVYMCANDLD